MGFFDKAQQVMGGGGRKMQVQVSTIGDQKLESIQADGAEYKILSAVKRHSPATLDEVIRDPQIKYSNDQVREIMIGLLNKGWLEEFKTGGG
jgi:hypothetical protein